MVHGRLAAAILLGVSAAASPASADAPAPMPLAVTYFGEMATHPGLLVGTERRLWNGGWHSLVVTGDLGGYTHPANHTGLMARTGLGHRIVLPGGWSTEVRAGLGYLHTFLGGEVYGEVDGGIGRINDGGRPGLMPVASLGLGLDGARLGLGSSRLFGRLTLFGQSPANNSVLWRPALELGASWNMF